MIKRYIIPTIAVLILTSGVMAGCNNVPSSEPTTTDTPTITELRAQVETLQEELNLLKEQKKAETLRLADAYYAIIKYGAGSSGATTIQRLTVEALVKQLQASGKFWSLIKATEDPYLISLCQPNESGVVACSYSQVKGYAEGKYRGLMSEYYSQEYIDHQLSILEQSIEKSPGQKTGEQTEGKVVINNLPFTYTGKGNGRTPAFWDRPAVSSEQYKLTFTTTWDGDISISWYREDTFRGLKPSLITMKVWRSTGISFGFPKRVEAGKTYEYIFNWSNSFSNALFLNIGNVPADGQWTITVSRIDVVTSEPKLDITVVVEYEGKFIYQSTARSSWGSFWYTGSGKTSRVFENIQIPHHYRARKEDGGTSPLVLKILYNGQVIAQDTAIGQGNEAYVFWQGPQ